MTVADGDGASEHGIAVVYELLGVGAVAEVSCGGLVGAGGWESPEALGGEVSDSGVRTGGRLDRRVRR